MRIAIFGCGYWANFQAAAWQACGGEIVAVWNRTRSKAEAFATHFGVKRVFDMPEEVFRWGAFDVADIITDMEAHERLVKMAAAFGKDVICQKPMSGTLESCKAMVDGCRRAGTWFAIHENFRYQPPTEAFIRAVRSGVIGRIVYGELNMRSPDREIMEQQPALRTMPYMVLRDMGPHIFDVARAAFGEMTQIFAVPQRSYADIHVPDVAYCTLTARNGAEIKCNLVHEWKDRFIAIGEKGEIVVDGGNVLHIAAGGDAQRIDTRTWQRLEYIPEADWNLHGGHVMAAIPRCLEALQTAWQERREAETSGADNLKTMEILFAAMRSFDSGKEEKIEEG